MDFLRVCFCIQNPSLCGLSAPPIGTQESSEVLPACSTQQSLSVPVSLQQRVLIHNTGGRR